MKASSHKKSMTRWSTSATLLPIKEHNFVDQIIIKCCIIWWSGARHIHSDLKHVILDYVIKLCVILRRLFMYKMSNWVEKYWRDKILSPGNCCQICCSSINSKFVLNNMQILTGHRGFGTWQIVKILLTGSFKIRTQLKIEFYFW